jgi:adenylate kinase
MLGGKSLDRVIVLTADTNEIVGRLLKRAQDQGRADDTEDVIRRRLEVYEEQTAPLIDLYKSRGLLVEVDGLGSVNEVTSRIMQSISN